MTSKAKIVTTVWPFTVKICQSLALYQLCPNSYKPDGEDQQTVFTIHTWYSNKQNFDWWKLNPNRKSQRNHFTGLLWHFALSQREKEIKTVILFNRKYSTPTWSPSWKSDTEQLQSFRAKQALHHTCGAGQVWGLQRKPPTHWAAASNKKSDRGS